MNSQGIILSDTNVIIKLILFSEIDLCGLEIPGIGKLKFHGIVVDEIKNFIKRDNKNKRVRVIENFGRETIEKALKKARNNLHVVNDSPSEDKKLAYKNYSQISKKIISNSADPSDEDLLLLFHCETNSCYMLSNDDIMYKLGKKIIGDKSLELEDIFIILIKEGIVKYEDVQTYSNLLGSYNESFKISKVYSAINRGC